MTPVELSTSSAVVTVPGQPLNAEPPAPARRGQIWAWVPMLILVGLIGTQLVVLRNVLDDPTFAIEHDYYQQALDWDAHRARQRSSGALGWKSNASAETSPGTASAKLQVRLSNAGGEALRGARLSLLAFHNARAAHPLQLEAEETAPGLYEAELGDARPGLWELRLHVVRGPDVYDERVRIEVGPETPR